MNQTMELMKGVGFYEIVSLCFEEDSSYNLY